MSPLRRLHRKLLLVLVVYFFAGTASQKLVPGVDEIFPFFGWSLFSKVPAEQTTYSITILHHDGRDLEPPASFLQAPPEMVTGNRYIARKVIQNLGRSRDRGEQAEEEGLRRLLEETYLQGRVRYELSFERYDPLAKWRRGENLEVRTLGTFEAGAPPEEPPQRRRWRKRRRPAPASPGDGS